MIIYPQSDRERLRCQLIWAIVLPIDFGIIIGGLIFASCL